MKNKDAMLVAYSALLECTIRNDAFNWECLAIVMALLALSGGIFAFSLNSSYRLIISFILLLIVIVDFAIMSLLRQNNFYNETNAEILLELEDDIGINKILDYPFSPLSVARFESLIKEFGLNDKNLAEVAERASKDAGMTPHKKKIINQTIKYYKFKNLSLNPFMRSNAYEITLILLVVAFVMEFAIFLSVSGIIYWF